MGLDRFKKTPCGFCFVEYYTHQDALDCMKYIGGTKLDERIIRTDLDEGFAEGRQYGFVPQSSHIELFRMLTICITDEEDLAVKFETNIAMNSTPVGAGTGGLMGLMVMSMAMICEGCNSDKITTTKSLRSSYCFCRDLLHQIILVGEARGADIGKEHWNCGGNVSKKVAAHAQDWPRGPLTRPWELQNRSGLLDRRKSALTLGFYNYGTPFFEALAPSPR